MAEGAREGRGRGGQEGLTSFIRSARSLVTDVWTTKSTPPPPVFTITHTAVWSTYMYTSLQVALYISTV